MLVCTIVLILNSKPYLYLVDKFIDPLTNLYTLLTCGLCSSTWVSTIFWLINIGFAWEVIGMVGISAILSELLDKLIKK